MIPKSVKEDVYNVVHSLTTYMNSRLAEMYVFHHNGKEVTLGVYRYLNDKPIEDVELWDGYVMLKKKTFEVKEFDRK